MRLLPERLALHDVRDVELLCRSVLDKQLKAWGAWLRSEEYDDALAYLIGKAWELSERYDRSKGLSFSTFFTRYGRLRITDWYRERFGDSRYGDVPRLESLELMLEDMAQEGAVDESDEVLRDDCLTRIAGEAIDRRQQEVLVP